MRNFTNKILLTISFIFILISCGGGDEPTPIPPIAPEFDEDALIGNWEIYYARKDLILLPERKSYPGFRNPEVDGFYTKFYKENNSYRFANYNPVNEVIDEGTYNIAEGYLVFNVKKYKGKDSTYVTKQNVTNFNQKDGVMSLNLSYQASTASQTFEVSDIRRLRNKQTAPLSHPGVTKEIINFDDMIGTWQVFDYVVLIDNIFSAELSKIHLAAEGISKFKFFYDDKGNKSATKTYYNPETKVTEIFTTSNVLIIDDVMHLDFSIDINNGSIENGGVFLWITERKPYLDPETNKQTEIIRDNDESRFSDRPISLYQTRRYLKKLQQEETNN